MTADLGVSADVVPPQGCDVPALEGPAATFGAVLRRLRKARLGPFTRNYGNRYETVFRELSQNELARRAGLNPSAINHMEHDGYPASPKRATVEALAVALELGPEERARLLVAAGYWPWTDLDPEAADFVLAAALAIVAGDWRPLERASMDAT